MTARRGRPTGAKNVHLESDAPASRCPSCGSTRRGPYLDKHVQEFAGEHAGEPFTHIIRRRVRCADCGQLRIDKTRENRPDDDGQD